MVTSIHASSHRSALGTAVCVVGLVLLGTNVGRANERDATLVEGLCQRSLFRQAKILCLDAIDRETTDADERANWYKLLFKTYAQQALNSPQPARDEIWQSAESDWKRFQQLPNSKQRPDVELQYRLIELARGELLALAVDLSPDRAAASQQASQYLRVVARALDKLTDSVAALQRPGSQDQPGRLANRELQELHSSIEFKLGEALRLQARCYPVGSPDQIHLLSQALRRFDSLARLSGQSALTQRSQLAEIDCHRRLGNLSDAQQAIEKLTQAELPKSLRDELMIQQAELLIDRKAARQAVELLSQRIIEPNSETDEATSALAELTMIRAYLVLARQASEAANDKLVKQWQSLALQLVQQMEERRSAYWVHLAEREVSSIRPGASGLVDIDVLARSAASQYRRQLFREAIDTYQRASQLALQLNDRERAFELGFQAAAIEYQQQEFPAARDDFQQLAVKHPSHVRAGQAHLLAITSAARLARTSPEDFATYEALLHEHLRQWTNDPSADQVRYWLGNLQQKREEWLNSIDTWILVTADFASIRQVRDGLRVSFLQLLDGDRLDATTKTDLARKAATYFEQAATEGRSAQDSWSELSREAITNAAVFRLFYTQDDPTPIVRPLQSALAAATEPPQWAAATQTLLGLAQALSGNLPAAQQQFVRANWPIAGNGIRIVARLDQACRSNPSRAESIGSLILLLKKRITDSQQELSNDDRFRLDRYEAEAQQQLGNRREAIRIYTGLTEQRPTDHDVQQRLATIYAEGTSDSDQTAALEYWRRVARLSPSGTPAWFQAKLGIAQAHLQLGNPQRAAEVIKLTIALHPDLGDEHTKRAFEKLRDELNQ